MKRTVIAIVGLLLLFPAFETKAQKLEDFFHGDTLVVNGDSLPYLMYWDKDAYALPYAGSPIRTSAGLWICAPHRSFSQLITSFFGSQCQGILLMLLLT